MSSVIAIEEGCPTVAGTATSVEELAPEIRALSAKLNVYSVLTGWAQTASASAEASSDIYTNAAMYLLVLDPDKRSTTLYPYPADSMAEANAHYARIEKEQPSLQAVLVAVDSLAALRTAYPNYYLDTAAFLQLVRKAVWEEEAS